MDTMFVFSLLGAIASIVTILEFWLQIMRRRRRGEPPAAPSRKGLIVATGLALTSLALSAAGYYGVGRPKMVGTVVGVLRADPMPGVVPYEAGKKVALNLWIVHRGPEPIAQDVKWIADVLLIDRGADLEKVWKDFRAKNGDFPPAEDFAAGSQVWRTLSTQELTAAEAKDISDGRLSILVLAVISYRDSFGTHVVEHCRLVQPPAENWRVWNACPSHNTTR